MICSITKPKQLGGISHIKVPTNNNSNKPTWISIYDPKEIESLVLHQHCQHFSQAHGTIFTVEPLQSLINDECMSEYAQQILAGTANIHDLPIDAYTKDLLTNLKSKVLPTKSPPTIRHRSPHPRI